MIYQLNNEFKFFPLKANYLDKEEFITDSTEFEERLIEELKMQEEIKAREENREIQEIKLPEIVYTKIEHTTEEINRIEECQKCNAQLGDVLVYVMSGKFPEKDHTLKMLEIQKLKEYNLVLNQSLAMEKMDNIKLKNIITTLTKSLAEEKMKGIETSKIVTTLTQELSNVKMELIEQKGSVE